MTPDRAWMRGILNVRRIAVLVVAWAIWGVGRQVRIWRLMATLNADLPTIESIQALPDAERKIALEQRNRRLGEKERVAVALGAMRARRAIPLLIDSLEDPDLNRGDWGFKAHVAQSLGDMGSDEAVEPLIRILQDASPASYPCRRVAASALWRITGEYIGMYEESWRAWLRENGAA